MENQTSNSKNKSSHLNQRASLIKKPIIIIWLILIIMAASYFMPIPYYQKEDFDCEPDGIHCIRKGWHQGLTLYDKLFLPKVPESAMIQDQEDPTANPDSIEANWKTYTNTKYNYQFKYPDKDWVFDWLVPPEPNEDIGTLDSISFLKTTTVPNKYVNQSVWWMRFFVSVQPNPNQLTPKEIYYFRLYTNNIPAGLSTSVPFENQYLKDLRNKVSRETKYPQGVENTRLLGYASLRETYNNWGSLTLVKDSLTFIMSWNIEDGKETAENAQQTFNQILSTFKFNQ